MGGCRTWLDIEDSRKEGGVRQDCTPDIRSGWGLAQKVPDGVKHKFELSPHLFVFVLWGGGEVFFKED